MFRLCKLYPNTYDECDNWCQEPSVSATLIIICLFTVEQNPEVSSSSSPTSPPFGFIERVFTADVLYKFLLSLIYLIIYFKFDISLERDRAIS